MTNLLDENELEYGLFLALMGLIVVTILKGLGVELNTTFI